MVAEDVIFSLPQSFVILINALGGVIFVYFVFNLANFFINRGKIKKMYTLLDEIKVTNQTLIEIRDLLKKKK